VLILLYLPSWGSNPIKIMPPVIEEGSSPVPKTENALYLKSEEIFFEIDRYVSVRGNYTIRNPTNESLNQTIGYPFYEHQVNTHWKNIYFDILGLTVNGSNTDISYRSNYEIYGPTIIFNISVQPNSEQNISIEYITSYEFINSTFCQLTYITTSAMAWNHSIDHAHFEFKFKNITITGNPSGGDIVYTEKDYVITEIERMNWTPDKNINVAWTTTIELDLEKDHEELVPNIQIPKEEDMDKKRLIQIISILFIIIILGFAILLIRKIRW
jgi:hypothetical protein